MPAKDLSVIIPGRNEEFMRQTIDNVLKNIKADTEVIAIFDGYWPDPAIPQNDRLTVIHHEDSIGQRAAYNEGVNLSQARYVMKLDAHCAIGPGFDRILMDNCEHDWTVVPRMYNLWAFDWECKRCGHRVYQAKGKPERCEKCGSRYSKKHIVWKEKTNPTSDYMRFDSDLKFQYWRDFKKRPEASGDVTDLMSFIGACWFMERSRHFEIGGLDEKHGSWGQVGTEMACKAWLSGGRLAVCKKTWFAHMFRTNRAVGFGFPYKISGKQVGHARRHNRKLFWDNTWDGQKYPLSWMLEKFWPVPGWTEEELKEAQKKGEEFYSRGKQEPAKEKKPQKTVEKKKLTKGIVYYTDNQCQERIATTVRKKILSATNGYAVTSVSQYPIDFGNNIVLPIERSVLSMFKQMLAGIEATETDIIFFCEHDVLYNKSHFEFTPKRDDTYYYNDNVWALDAKSGQALHYAGMKQVSGLCAHRTLLLDHYKRRVEHVEKHGFKLRLGYEPGKKKKHGGLDDYKYEYFTSEKPIIDIKHPNTITPGRFKLDQYRCRNRIKDSWVLSDEIPLWGKTKGRFDDFLRGVA